MCDVEMVDSKGSAGATEKEIEVTSEMVAAGEAALEKRYIGDGRYDLTSAVAEIYLVMAAAKFLLPAPERQIRCVGH
jgi:hypothetical protein